MIIMNILKHIIQHARNWSAVSRTRLKENHRGFTLLLAALIASIVLSLGAAIFTIAQKEVLLSSIGRDSQFAFYAADTAAECGLYWDFRFNYFATSTPPGVTPSCDTVPLNATGNSSSYPYTVTSVPMNLFADQPPPNGNLCAQITVTKSLDPNTGSVLTTIHADGYSVDCASININPRALQRSVELHY